MSPRLRKRAKMQDRNPTSFFFGGGDSSGSRINDPVSSRREKRYLARNKSRLRTRLGPPVKLSLACVPSDRPIKLAMRCGPLFRARLELSDEP